MGIGATRTRRHGIIRLDHARPDHRVRHHRQVFDVQSSEGHSSLGSAWRKRRPLPLRAESRRRQYAGDALPHWKYAGPGDRFEAIVSAPAAARHPIGNIRLCFHTSAYLGEYSPCSSGVTAGNLRLRSPRDASSVGQSVPYFALCWDSQVTILRALLDHLPPSGTIREHVRPSQRAQSERTLACMCIKQ